MSGSAGIFWDFFWDFWDFLGLFPSVNSLIFLKKIRNKK
jgi:hypothetical protein